MTFTVKLAGVARGEPWQTINWDENPHWDFTSAAGDTLRLGVAIYRCILMLVATPWTSAARVGLTGTVITSDELTIINSIGQDSGFADWAAMWDWAAKPRSAGEEEQVVRRMLGCAALDPARTSRTTPRDMATLLRLIWSDQGRTTPLSTPSSERPRPPRPACSPRQPDHTADSCERA